LQFLVLALIVTAIWMLLTYLVACFICDVVISSNGRCRHLADAGYELGGKWGRITFRTFQYANLLFYLPVALGKQKLIVHNGSTLWFGHLVLIVKPSVMNVYFGCGLSWVVHMIWFRNFT